MKIKFLFAVLALSASMATAETIEATVNGLVCGFCAQGIDKTLRKHSATADVVVSLENRLVAVAMKEGMNLTDEELRTALTNAGYEVKAIARTETPIGEIRAKLKAAK